MEEEIDLEVNLGKELADKINKMTKQELINYLIVEILQNKVRFETIDELEKERNQLELKISGYASRLQIAKDIISGITKNL